jgi:Zn-finger nucleic acid-binding protein
MARKKFKPKQAEWQRDETLKILGNVTADQLARVGYLARMTTEPDGFPTNTRLGPRGGATSAHTQDCTWQTGECVCGAAADKSSSTEAAALMLYNGKTTSDPIGDACDRVDKALRIMTKEAQQLRSALDVIENAAKGNKLVEIRPGVWADPHKRPTWICSACGADLQDDDHLGQQLKAGYCPACYRAWLRTDKGNGRQDRNQFEQDRQYRREVSREHPATGYGVDELDELQANGSLPRQATA